MKEEWLEKWYFPLHESEWGKIIEPKNQFLIYVNHLTTCVASLGKFISAIYLILGYNGLSNMMDKNKCF